ncbi:MULTISPECIES: metal-dependent transcriptional regulator [unclassified Salinibacterium]|uniref:metal-dependent transcriptional regulator n=1 Tax=unclassified Salinibacterium TaxID=2632331 RepID=UPI00141FC475|nr:MULTISPECIES: metal-dependent transcriptional regulator [unclassified Salinibacterium]
MTTVIEDYVKTIYSHTEWQPDPITPSALAARLGLAASSVTEMVKKLRQQGLVAHEKYGAITLTDAGMALALGMVRKHRLVETWLAREFGYGWDEVHEEAEILEHALSDRLLDAIDDKLGRPAFDPHGDPIPSRDGTIERPDATLLADVAEHRVVRVVRVSDRDPRLLRHLAAEGLTVGSELTVIGRTPFGGAFAVRVAGDDTEHDLGDQALTSIWVAPAA